MRQLALQGRRRNRDVVVGIGEVQPAVLAFAAHEADRLGSSLHVVHSYSPESADPSAERRAARLAADVVDGARAVVEATCPDLEADYVARPGSPDDLLRSAARDGEDLVVGPDGELPPYLWVAPVCSRVA